MLNHCIDERLSRKLKNMAFVCALLVVTIHIGVRADDGAGAWFFSQIVVNGIARIAVPFFFVVSGFLLAQHIEEPSWWVSAIKKRVKTLLVPYVLWSVISILSASVLAIIADVIAHRSFGYSLYVLRKPLVWFGLDLFEYPYLVPLWYVRCLLLLIVGAPFLLGLLRRFGKFFVGLLFLLSVAAELLLDGDIRSLLTHGISVSGCCYFSFGLLLALQGKCVISSKMAIVSAIVGFAILSLKVFIASRGAFSESAVVALAIPFLLVSAWYYAPAAQYKSWLLSCAFPIYLIHPIVFPYVDVVFKAVGLQYSNWAQCVVNFFCGCLFPILLCLLMRTRARNVANVLFGGRC